MYISSYSYSFDPLYVASLVRQPLFHIIILFAEDRSWYVTCGRMAYSVPVYPPHPLTLPCTLKEVNVCTVTQLIKKSVITQEDRECTDVVQ